MKHNPAKFGGKTTPNDVDQWMKDLERVFYVKQHPRKNRLAYIVYILTREAGH